MTAHRTSTTPTKPLTGTANAVWRWAFGIAFWCGFAALTAAYLGAL